MGKECGDSSWRSFVFLGWWKLWGFRWKLQDLTVCKILLMTYIYRYLPYISRLPLKSLWQKEKRHRSVFLHPRDLPNDGYYLKDHPSQVASNPISKKPLRLFGRGPTTLFREPIPLKSWLSTHDPRCHGMIFQDPQDPHLQDPLTSSSSCTGSLRPHEISSLLSWSIISWGNTWCDFLKKILSEKWKMDFFG